PLLGGVFRQWRRQVDLSFKDQGLSDATRMPLLVLYVQGEPLRQKDLANALFLDTSSLVRVLNYLRKARLVDWSSDPDDRRTKRIGLTPAGRQVAAAILAKSQEIERTILADLTPHEREVTLIALEKTSRRFHELSAPARQRARRIPTRQPVSQPESAMKLKGSPYAWVSFAMIVGVMGTALISPLYALYKDTWQLQTSDISVLYVVYMGGALCSLLFLGRLPDRLGFRPMMQCGLALVVVGTFASLAAWDLASLCAGRFVVGVASSLVTTSSTLGLARLSRSGSVQRTAMMTGFLL